MRRLFDAAAGSFLLVFGAIALCFVVDFTKAFYIFHTIFFSNDLWMLPSDAVMIKMVPQAFFSDCALLLAGFFGGFLLLSCAAAFVCALCFKTPPPQEDQPMLRPRRGGTGKATTRSASAPRSARRRMRSFSAWA